MFRSFITHLILFFFTGFSVYGQCPDCDPDLSCFGEEGPTSCPEVLPDATTNEYYEEVVTFYLPETFSDPTSGFDVTLNQVIITNITGIPFGMEATFNEEDLTYLPSSGENHGCVNICGTPILAGLYEGSVTFQAEVVVLGLELTVNESFPILLNVIQGDGANNSFGYDQISGCGSVEIDFEGLINGAPQPTTWTWDFGNGNTSGLQFPETQIYNEPGEYIVSLETQIFSYVLTEVSLESLSSGWAGDIDELIEFLADPDPYFVIEDSFGNAIYTSSSQQNTDSFTWTDLSLELNELPYSINWYDEDDFSDDDFLGSFEFSNDVGLSSFNVNSGTSGQIEIQLQEDDVFYNEETVSVFEIPEVEITVSADNQIFSIEDEDIATYQWYIDGEAIEGEIQSSIEITSWGIYSCWVTTPFGCSSFSDEVLGCPEFELIYDSETDMLSTPEEFVSYQWFYNGLALVGETNQTLDVSGGGQYTVQIVSENGCDYLSNPFTIAGISEMSQINWVRIYPNPSNGSFVISLDNESSQTVLDLQLFDMQGRLLHQETSLVNGSQKVDLRGVVSRGNYLLVVQSEKTTTSHYILIE